MKPSAVFTIYYAPFESLRFSKSLAADGTPKRTRKPYMVGCSVGE